MVKRMSQKKSVLLLEDESELRSAVKELLTSAGLEVIEADNGREALKIIGTFPVNAVLTDIKMPQMDGMEFVAELKKSKPGIPVIFFSGYVDKELCIKALRLGAFDLIEKPAKRDEILTTVRMALAKEDSNLASKLEALNLNSTQAKILELILRGLGNKEIAGEVRLSEQGVKYHVGNLFRRFEASDRAALKVKIRDMVGTN